MKSSASQAQLWELGQKASEDGRRKAVCCSSAEFLGCGAQSSESANCNTLMFIEGEWISVVAALLYAVCVHS